MITRLRNKISKIILRSGLKAPRYKQENLSSFFKSYRITDANLKSLDLGSGPEPRNPFDATDVVGVDIRSYEMHNVVYGDIASGALPFESEMFDYVTAYDVLEHIHRVTISSNGKQAFPLVMLMNEVFRVLKPGGIFFNIQPCYPMKEAFQDPTHVNIMTEDTIKLYFCDQAWARIYGYEGSFTMLEDGWIGCKYFSYIRKSRNTPIKDLNFIQR